jgi:hypothetical protein
MSFFWYYSTEYWFIFNLWANLVIWGSIIGLAGSLVRLAIIAWASYLYR